MEPTRNQETVNSVHASGSSNGTSDLSTPDDNLQTALANAIGTNDWDTFRSLLARQPQINDNLLRKAVGFETLPHIDAIINELTNHGLAMSVFCGDHDNEMFNAIRYKDMEALKTLLQVDENLHLVRNTSGKISPLHVAIFYKQRYIAKLLLKSGANVFSEDGQGCSPIDYVVKSKYFTMVHQFEDFAVMKEGLHDAFLLSAVCNNRFEFITCALFRGGNVFVRSKSGHSLLHRVCNARNGVKVVKELLDYGADPNENIGSGTLLHHSRNRRVTELLLQYGADINRIDSDGNTPLTKSEPGFEKTALKRHLVMLKVAGLYVSARNLEQWKETKYMKDFAAECEKEIPYFKALKIGNFPYSAYDILTLSVNRLGKMAGNKAWLEAMDKHFYKGVGVWHPVYYRLISTKFRMGNLRHKFLEKGLKSLEIILPSLPILCSDNIVIYLGNEEIHNLCVVSNHQT